MENAFFAYQKVNDQVLALFFKVLPNNVDFRPYPL